MHSCHECEIRIISRSDSQRILESKGHDQFIESSVVLLSESHDTVAQDQGAVDRRYVRMDRPGNPFFTIGHSTRPLNELVELLKESSVRLLIDVRTVPRSRTNPQFNREVMAASLAPYDIEYEHMAALGGLRGKQRGLAPTPNTFWENDSFRNYADYALTVPFREGLARLLVLGHSERSAIMCSEAVWWRCHRRIIADYLITAGEAVYHIMGPGKTEPAKLTPAAHATAEGALVYPA